MPPAEIHPHRRSNAPGGRTHSKKVRLHMPIQIDQWNFDGPFHNTAPVQKRSGAYAILTRQPGTGMYRVVDAGESGDLRFRLDNHDRAECWRRNSNGELAVAVLYCDQPSRMAIEARLRQAFNPTCGIR